MSEPPIVEASAPAYVRVVLFEPNGSPPNAEIVEPAHAALTSDQRVDANESVKRATCNGRASAFTKKGTQQLLVEGAPSEL